jgi:APA family basic amino acid/polyamine antiporter
VNGGSLKRVLKLRDVLALSFGAMIGWSWVALTGTWISQAGAAGAAMAFLLGGVAMVLIGLTYAELAAAMPQVGGEHVYSYRAMGAVASFVCTWGILMGYVAVVAFEAVALPTVVVSLAPGLSAGYLWTIAGWDVYASWVLIGVLGAALVTWINIRGVRTAASMQLMVVIGLLIAGLMVLVGGLAQGSLENFVQGPALSLSTVTGVMIIVPFMFVGFDVIPQAAEEINLPSNQIGRALMLSVLVAVAWYVLIIVAVGLSLSPSQLLSTGLATADAASLDWGSQWMGRVVLGAGIAGILTSWNAFLMGAGRATYALAHCGMLPRWLGVLHPRYGTPHRAILVVGLTSMIAPLFGRPMLVWVANAGGLGIVIAYIMVVASFLILRRTEPDMPRPYRVAAGNWVGALAMVLSLGIAWLYLPGSPAGLVWPYEWAIVGGWALLGLTLYGWSRWRYGAPDASVVLEQG